MNRQAKAYVVISVFVFLFAGFLAFAQSTPPQPLQQLTVWDSRGRMVGNVHGIVPFAEGQASVLRPTVAFRGEGTVIILGVSTNLFFGSGLGTFDEALYFQSGDCTGTSYFPAPGEPGVPDPAPMFPISVLSQNKVYVQVGSPIPLLIGSSFFPGICNSFDGAVMSVRQLRLEIDLNIFTPPFTVR